MVANGVGLSVMAMGCGDVRGWRRRKEVLGSMRTEGPGVAYIVLLWVCEVVKGDVVSRKRCTTDRRCPVGWAFFR